MQTLTETRPTSLRKLRSTGFTLLELALTLAILGVLAAAVLVPFVAQVAQRNIASTERILENAKDALLGFAVANGRLPCPATGGSNGQEMPPGGGACTSSYGFLPAATLGVTPIDANGYAVDGWATPPQNRVRYAVSSNGGANTFTTAGGMKTAGAAALSANVQFVVCTGGAGANPLTPACGPAPIVTLTDRAVVLIWSVGANALTGGTNADEAQNPHPNGNTGAQPQFGTADRIFVSRMASNVAASEFDDILVWIPVTTLVSRMVLGGQLP